MKKLLLILSLCLFITSCNRLNKKERIKVGGKYSIELPASMAENKNINKDASLQYQDIHKELYTIVIDEGIKDYEKIIVDNDLTDIYNLNLEGYAMLITDNIDPSIALDSVSDFEKIEINNLPSLILSMDGVSQGHHIYWKFAFLQGKTRYYQVMVWTLASNKKKYEKEMVSIIKSFQETDRSGK